MVWRRVQPRRRQKALALSRVKWFKGVVIISFGKGLQVRSTKERAGAP